MTTDSLCPLCRSDDESLFHRFRDCPASLAIWGCLNLRNQYQFYGDNNWGNWLQTNLCGKSSRGEDSNWSLLFGVTLDQLWRNRNDFIFSQKTFSAQATLIKIRYQVEGLVDCIQRNSILNPYLHLFEMDESFKWEPPPPSFLKLNCDGSVCDSGRSVGCGGVIRDDHGGFILAFKRRLHRSSVLEAELTAIHIGLQIAWGRNINNLIIESDSIHALEAIERGFHDDISLNQLVVGILDVGRGQLNVRWRKVKRDNNCVADKLAKACHVGDGNVVIFDILPDFLVNALALDSIGLDGVGLH